MVFRKVQGLVPDFFPSFEKASVSAFREVFGDVNVSGYWFSYGQAIVKCMQKVGLKEAYVQEESVKKVVQCSFGLPLLPVDDISAALEDVRLAIPSDSPHAEKL